MSFHMSQEENVVENHPFAQSVGRSGELGSSANSGPLAAAAFRAGRTSSVQGDAEQKAAATKKKRRRSSGQQALSPTQLTAASSSAAVGAVSPISSHSKKRRLPQRDEEESKAPGGAAASSSSALPAALSSALSEQFEPAQLSSLLPAPSASSSSPPLCLFQFPAKFDITAFAALGLQLPARRDGEEEEEEEERELRHQQFSLHGVRYRLLEADVSDVSELVSLLPAAFSSSASSSRLRGRLLPARPVTRLFRVIGVVTPGEAEWTPASALSSSSSALLRSRPLQSPVVSIDAGRRRPVWRPIGFIADHNDPHHLQHRRQQPQQPTISVSPTKEKRKKRRREERGAEQEEKQPALQRLAQPQLQQPQSQPRPQHQGQPEKLQPAQGSKKEKKRPVSAQNAEERAAE